ncbi:MAG: methionyl-tRNA formyltransferase [Pseudomonadota bacterium]|nr:MAG: methionyl-tRNA formyltransferase [Pseudomonadota bacterium]
MRVVFAGTPAFAVPALAALLDHPRCEVVAVLTQPDRRAGRGRKLRPGPVKQVAEAAGIAVFQPERLSGRHAPSALLARDIDLLVTAAYGLLLPSRVLDWPALGCWNLHASLLPRWRGASPIQQAILAGDRYGGISLMKMDTGLDTGPVILQSPLAIEDEETAGELHDRLAALAASLLRAAIDRLDAGTLPVGAAQDDRLATHAPLIRREDAWLDWRAPADSLARRVRAFHPWPVAFGEIEETTFRIHRARAADGSAQPGVLIGGAGRDVVAVGCGQGVLEIRELQAPGRRRVSARDWWNARSAGSQ